MKRESTQLHKCLLGEKAQEYWKGWMNGTWTALILLKSGLSVWQCHRGGLSSIQARFYSTDTLTGRSVAPNCVSGHCLFQDSSIIPDLTPLCPSSIPFIQTWRGQRLYRLLTRAVKELIALFI